jgi:AcrR family transcriptional regulator
MDRRAQILAVAMRRFAEFGFEATTVRQIADDVKVLSGSLYHHFVTKDEMLHEIVRDAVFRLRDNAVRISRSPNDPEKKLVALIIMDLEEMTSNQEVHAILYNERKFFRRSDEFSYVLQAKKDGYRAWRSVLEDGVETGRFKPSLDVHLTISTIIRMMNTAADWYKNDDIAGPDQTDPYTLDQIIDFNINFVLGSVLTENRALDPKLRAECEALARLRD